MTHAALDFMLASDAVLVSLHERDGGKDEVLQILVIRGHFADEAEDPLASTRIQSSSQT